MGPGASRKTKRCFRTKIRRGCQRLLACTRGYAHARGHSRGVRIGSLVVVRNVSDLSLWSHFRERSRVRAHVSPRCVVNVLRVAFESSFLSTSRVSLMNTRERAHYFNYGVLYSD